MILLMLHIQLMIIFMYILIIQILEDIMVEVKQVYLIDYDFEKLFNLINGIQQFLIHDKQIQQIILYILIWKLMDEMMVLHI